MTAFRAQLELGGKTATGIRVPSSAVQALGAGKRVPVVVTINGSYTYRTTVAPYGGDFLIPVSAEHREGAGIEAGDQVDVSLAVDDQPRTVDVPAALAAALDAAGVRPAFDKLSYTLRKEAARTVTEAKAEETRDRRIGKIVGGLSS
jgi:hypothetical protein